MTYHPPDGSSVTELVEAAVAAAHGGPKLSDAQVEALLDAAAEESLPAEVEYPDEPIIEPDLFPAWGEEARTVLRTGDGDYPEARWLVIQELISHERLEQLIAGADPTPDEMLRFARRMFQGILDEGDLGDHWGCSRWKLTSRGGQQAWLAQFIRGYSFSGLDYELGGPFATQAELESAIRDRGYESAEEITLNDARRLLERKV